MVLTSSSRLGWASFDSGFLFRRTLRQKRQKVRRRFVQFLRKRRFSNRPNVAVEKRHRRTTSIKLRVVFQNRAGQWNCSIKIIQAENYLLNVVFNCPKTFLFEMAQMVQKDKFMHRKRHIKKLP